MSSSGVENDVPETWARIPSWPLYEASTAGRIRRADTGRVLIPSPATQQKYLIVNLARDGKRRTVYVHRAIAEAHLGSIEGKVVHHRNGCPQDARVVNLEITSHRINMQRSQVDGTAHVLTGERAPEHWGRCGYLMPMQVQTLRRARATGKRGAVAELAREFGCSYKVANNAACGVTYAWVGETSLETELNRGEALAQRAARKATAQVQRARAARAANPHTPPAAAASARPRFAVSKKEGE